MARPRKYGTVDEQKAARRASSNKYYKTHQKEIRTKRKRRNDILRSCARTLVSLQRDEEDQTDSDQKYTEASLYSLNASKRCRSQSYIADTDVERSPTPPISKISNPPSTSPGRPFKVPNFHTVWSIPVMSELRYRADVPQQCNNLFHRITTEWIEFTNGSVAESLTQTVNSWSTLSSIQDIRKQLSALIEAVHYFWALFNDTLGSFNQSNTFPVVIQLNEEFSEVSVLGRWITILHRRAHECDSVSEMSMEHCKRILPCLS